MLQCLTHDVICDAFEYIHSVLTSRDSGLHAFEPQRRCLEQTNCISVEHSLVAGIVG